MTKNRETMLDNLIRKYGFEHPWVVAFCKWCEEWKNNSYENKCLKEIYEEMMNYVEEEEEA